ncbi:acetamidase [Protofrankia sp. BMG5.30]|uniref:Acetamidase n=1 Tax=Protofrankia coriariae TaxID=1562887 RepID=A0ABR5F4Q5_9ACTN|nr:acetamidase [Protofrankia coriariae]ONH38430.1 acetamidase [Protofrankia sp. BMG5.30]
MGRNLAGYAAPVRRCSEWPCSRPRPWASSSTPGAPTLGVLAPGAAGGSPGCHGNGVVALQPGKGKMDGRHYLPSTPETILWGRLPTADTRPVLSVESGATVTIDTVSQEGILDDQGRDPDAFFGRFGVPASEVLDDARMIASSGIPHRFGVDSPHLVTGPVFVRGAEPGDVLRVDVVSLHPRARYGVVSTRHGAGLLTGEFPENDPPGPDANARNWAAFRTTSSFCAVERRRGRLFGALEVSKGRKVRFPLSPFMGIMSVAVDSPGPVRSTSVGIHGGALDCGELVIGSRLFLPVRVAGALFAVGDPHYSLGDGKVATGGLEGPLRATFRLTVLKEPAARAALGTLREPFAETDTHWVPLGAQADLTDAARQAARSAVLFLSSRLGMDRADALAYLSAAAVFGIGRSGSDLQTVYCRIRRADFGEPAAAKPRLVRPGFGRAAPTPATDSSAPGGSVPATSVPGVSAPGSSTAGSGPPASVAGPASADERSEEPPAAGTAHEPPDTPRPASDASGPAVPDPAAASPAASRSAADTSAPPNAPIAEPDNAGPAPQP